MNSLAQRRARIVRVRSVQHMRAAAVASEAEARVVELETNAGRLATLRGGLAPVAGTALGGALAAQAELAQRLEAARAGMTDGIAAARAHADARSSERLAARIAQEGAHRLERRAVKALQDDIEARLAASYRPRPGGAR